MAETSKLDQLKIDRKAKTPGPPKAVSWIIGGLLLALVGLVVFIFFQIYGGPAPVTIKTARVIERSQGDTGAAVSVLDASGYVTARRQATVSSKITGKLVEVNVEEGMRIDEGQVVARLDDSNVLASLNLAKAQHAAAQSALEETRVRLREAQTQLRRISELNAVDVVSDSELDVALANAQSQQARLDRLMSEVGVTEQQIALYEQQRDDTIVRAPFAGIAISKDAQVGEMISPVSAGGGFTRTGICTLVDMDSLEIEVDVNETYINRVTSDQPVLATLDAYPNWKIPAKVLAIIPAADRQKATFKVRIVFDALDPKILPDMGIKVAFQPPDDPTSKDASQTSAPQAPTLWIPADAVAKTGGSPYAFVVQPNDRVERRAITMGNRYGDQIQVLSGLRGGERIVLKPGDDLVDGAPIEFQNP